MRQYYVYMYLNPLTFEPFYIGKGYSTKGYDRAYRHIRYDLKNGNLHFIRRLKKFTLNGLKPIIHKIFCTNEQIALGLEKGLIKIIGRDDLKTGPLLNLTDGGEGSSGRHIKYGPLSEKTKIKMSSIWSEEKRKEKSIWAKENNIRPPLKSRTKPPRVKVGRSWWNNGKISVRGMKPEGNEWVKGRLISKCSCINCHVELPINTLKQHQTGKYCYVL